MGKWNGARQLAIYQPTEPSPVQAHKPLIGCAGAVLLGSINRLAVRPVRPPHRLAMGGELQGIESKLQTHRLAPGPPKCRQAGLDSRP